MAKKDEVPKHLSHIDKKAGETQKIVKGLKGNEAEPAKKKTGVIIQAGATEKSPYQKEIDRLIDRLEESWVPHSPAKKQFIRNQISQAKRNEPASLPDLLRREHAVLDEAERVHLEKGSKKKGTNRAPGEEPGILERLRFWWFKVQNSDLYTAGKPSESTLGHFHTQVKSLAAQFMPLMSQIVNQLYNRDFFLPGIRDFSNFRAYNLMALLSKEQLGVALSRITPTGGYVADHAEKIAELDDFAKIYLILRSDSKAEELILSTLKDLKERISHPAQLNALSQTLITCRPADFDRALAVIPVFFDHEKRELQIMPRLLACYSFLLGRVGEPSDVMKMLEADPDRIPYKIQKLTDEARRHLDKTTRELKAEIHKQEENLHHVSLVENELEFAEEVFRKINSEMATQDRRLSEDDPFSWFNGHILDFLVIFEDLLAGRERIELLEIPNASHFLIAGMPPESVKSLSSFPIKQDLLGKIRKLPTQDAGEFRQLLMNPQTETYKTFSKQVEYVKKINGRLALHFAHLFDKELTRLRDHDFDKLGSHILKDTIQNRLNAFYVLGRTSTGEDGKLASVNLHFRDKFGKAQTYDADSLYAFLKLGKCLLTYIAWEMRDPSLIQLLESRAAADQKLKETEAQLKLFDEPPAVAPPVEKEPD